MKLCCGTSFLGQVKKNVVSVNASVEARSALISPIMDFGVVQSIELP